MKPSWYRSGTPPPAGHTHGAERRSVAGINADAAELDKFSEAAQHFWDPRGEFRPLHALNPARAQFVRERAQLADARVLDVGCGGGLLAEALADARARVTAIDLSPAMITVAGAHAAERTLAIDYRLASAEALAASEAGRFDVVTCMEMLEHVPDPAAMVATLSRLVRPGGQLFISTVHRNLKSFLGAIVAAEYLLRLLPRGTHEFERFIRPAELARWARAAGLELREIAGLHYDPLTQHVRLSDDPSVNYLAYLTRPSA